MKLRLGLFALLILAHSFTSFAGILKKQSKIQVETETNSEGILFFEGSWDEALVKARNEKKVIFLDAYASWCGPCKIMARTTFKNEEVGAFFNEHFVNFKMDMEKDVDGPRLSKKFHLIAYPTLYFVDVNEKIVKQEMGYFKVKPFLKIGKEVVALK